MNADLAVYYTALAAPMLKYCARRGLDTDDALDLVQDVFAEAFAATANNVTASWLWSKLCWRRIDFIRKQAGRQVIGLSESMAEETERLEFEPAVEKALARLNPLHQAMLYERYYEGLSCVESAARHGISASAVRQQRINALNAAAARVGVEGTANERDAVANAQEEDGMNDILVLGIETLIAERDDLTARLAEANATLIRWTELNDRDARWFNDLRAVADAVDCCPTLRHVAGHVEIRANDWQRVLDTLAHARESGAWQPKEEKP